MRTNLGRPDMRHRYGAGIAILIALTTAPPHGASGKITLSAIPIGISRIDLDGDGHLEVVVRAWRENFNAHGFFVLSFYSEDPERQALVKGRSAPAALGVIPVERGDGTVFATSISTDQGAECVVRLSFLALGSADHVGRGRASSGAQL
jgi:hypothetical protein